MEIKRVNKSLVKSNIAASIDMGAIKSMENSALKEQAIWQNTANSVINITAKAVNNVLVNQGKKDAMLDASKDVKQQEEYNTASREYDEKQMADLQNEDDFFKQSKEEKRFLIAEENLKTKNLDMSDGSYTAYGKSYQAKAQQIGLNKLLIDLDKTSTELYVENVENPVEFSAALQQYSEIVKEQLPQSLHASWDEKVALKSLSANKDIAKNVKIIQDGELAATMVDKLDITRTNLLDAADKRNASEFVDNKDQYISQIEEMYEKRIIKSRVVADEEIRTVVDAANSTMILSEFNDTLSDDLAGAIKLANNFSSKTSKQLYGLSERQINELKGTKNKAPKDNIANPLDIEYDIPQRDKIAAQMFAAIKSKQTLMSAQNKQYKADANKFINAEIELLKAGKVPANPVNRKSLIPNVSAGKFEMEQLDFYRENLPDIIAFNALPTTQEKEAYVAKIKSTKVTDPNSIELIKTYEENIQESKKNNIEDSGLVTNNMLYGAETFAPQYDPMNPVPFLEAKLPYTNYLNSTENAPKNLMSNGQANQTKAAWENMGRIDKDIFVREVGKSPTAELFFDQMGNVGSEMKVIYNVVSGNQPGAMQVTSTIHAGQERIDNKLTKYNEAKINQTIDANLNGRMEYMDGDTKKAYYKAIAAYALGANPESTLIDKDDTDTDDMIKEAMDNVFGKVDTDYFGNMNMVLYNKDRGKVQDYMDNTSVRQVASTVPPEEMFYFNNKPLSANVLSEEIQNGKVQLVGTGVAGEYLLRRNGRIVMTSKRSQRERADGYIWMQKKVYRFKLWNEAQ